MTCAKYPTLMSAPVKSTELKKYKMKFACCHVVKKAKIALKWTVARENRIHAGPRFEFKWQFRKLGGL